MNHVLCLQILFWLFYWHCVRLQVTSTQMFRFLQFNIKCSWKNYFFWWYSFSTVIGNVEVFWCSAKALHPIINLCKCMGIFMWATTEQACLSSKKWMSYFHHCYILSKIRLIRYLLFSLVYQGYATICHFFITNFSFFFILVYLKWSLLASINFILQ